MNIKDIPEYERPRERMKQYGVEILSDAELLALVLQKGTKKDNIISISHKLLSEYNLAKIGSLSLNELRQIHGIGEVKAMQLLAVFELHKRISTIKPLQINSARSIFKYFKGKLRQLPQEHFIIVMLNKKHMIIKEKTVAIGTVDSVMIHPREIFRDAIKENASAIIIVHNHPSGDPEPSNEDIQITKKLMQIGEEIGIQVLDHVIIGDKYWSWSEDITR